MLLYEDKLYVTTEVEISPSSDYDIGFYCFNISGTFLWNTTFGDSSYKEYPKGKKILDVYKESPFYKKLHKAVVDWKQKSGQKFAEDMPHPAFLRFKL